MKWDKEVFDKNFWRGLALIAVAVAFYFMCANLPVILQHVQWIFGLFAPFIWGFVFAFLLNGTMVFFETKVCQKVANPRKRRFWSVLWTFVVSLGTVILMCTFLLPQLGRSLQTLATKVPEYVESLGNQLASMGAGNGETTLNWEAVGEAIQNWLTMDLQAIFETSGRVLSSIMNALIGLVIAVYFLSNKENYLAQLRLVGHAIFSDKVMERIELIMRYGRETFTGFFYSKLLDSLLVGIICFIAMLIFRMPYALLISVIVGVTNIIPFFGPFIGAIPSALIILAVDPVQALWFVVFIIVLQQFDGNIMGPMIMSDSVGLPAILVMFAILIGGGMFGFVGMILGIPVFAMVYNLLRELLHERLLEKDGGQLRPRRRVA